MLIARAPVRISFAGGGTDLEAYYAEHGGMVVSATIDKYFYVFLTPNQGGSLQITSSDYRAFYRHANGSLLLWDGDLRLPKAILHEFGIDGGLSIFLASEVPPGTGLGSSSTVAVALVKTRSRRADVTLVFTVKGWPSGDGTGLRTFTAEDAIEDQGVTFAVVDRQPSKPWFGDPLAAPVRAWLDAGPYFQRLSDNGEVAAYRVALPAASGHQARSAAHGQ